MKMKRKTPYIFAMCALALAGCQERIVPEEGLPIRFAISSAENVTKGELINTDGSDKALADKGVKSFKASAYNGSNALFSNQDVTYASGKWSTANTYYWPQATSLTFLAYANLPEGQTATIATTGVSKAHTVPSEASAQKDILFGHYQGNGCGTGTAEIHFEHPLTAVRFLRGDIDASLVIKSISIKGVAASGTATMDSNGTVSWSDLGAYTHTVSQTKADGLGEDGTTKLIGEPFIIIPQDLAVNKVRVNVTFTDGTMFEASISSGEWQAGKTNTYTLNIDGSIVSLSPEEYNGCPLGVEMVDLGLSVKWASMNIGATSPEDYGWYFFWGGTTGYVPTNISGTNCKWVNADDGTELNGGFTWANSPFNGGASTFDAAYFSSIRNTVCPEGILAPEYDAAHANWGGTWHMPTYEEFLELLSNCTCAWTDNYKGTGEKGLVITSNMSGYEDKSIFLPAAGYGYENQFWNADIYGDYWSPSLDTGDPQNAFELFLQTGEVKTFKSYRYQGMTVRPVSE